MGVLDYRNRRPSYASKKRRIYSLHSILPELTGRNASFSSISIAEGEEWPIGGSVRAHAFQRKSGQFIMLKYSSASVHSICTSDTSSSSLSSDLLRRSSALAIEHAQCSITVWVVNEKKRRSHHNFQWTKSKLYVAHLRCPSTCMIVTRYRNISAVVFLKWPESDIHQRLSINKIVFMTLNWGHVVVMVKKNCMLHIYISPLVDLYQVSIYQ